MIDPSISPWIAAAEAEALTLQAQRKETRSRRPSDARSLISQEITMPPSLRLFAPPVHRGSNARAFVRLSSKLNAARAIPRSATYAAKAHNPLSMD
ncbi:hypothetical protein IM816_10925 [Luteibacter flocculans]|uniref:Uncharacterized protein n=1 Tax=Luteibacter flocculans TaxID=2780091 RepID=A0ABY4SWS9_9GAMM|nr:hypothetical protein [Luteibacter flocculans]URL57167.1 hypothetical protein IM816_10925 [Luteibacter flocculans]